MARIKYSSIVSSLSGSVGGATFQAGLYGSVLRSKPLNTKNATSSQLYARSVMQRCQYAWTAMSDAQRRQWDQFIAFSGQSIRRDRTILITGHALFLKYNFHRLMAGYTVITDIVYLSTPEWPSFVKILHDVGGFTAQFSDVLPDIDIWISLSLSTPLSSIKSYSPSGIRYMLPTGTASYYVYFLGPYEAAFGKGLENGDIVNYKLNFWSTLSPIVSPLQTGVLTVNVPL